MGSLAILYWTKNRHSTSKKYRIKNEKRNIYLWEYLIWISETVRHYIKWANICAYSVLVYRCSFRFSASHSDSKWIKPARNRFTSVCLMWFHEFFKATFSVSISGKWMSITFKIGQTVAGISIISQFYELFWFNFRRNFAFWPNCASSSG